MERSRRIGLILGPVAFLAACCLPESAGLELGGRRTAGLALLMAIFWVTEAIPIPATALLPVCLLPALGIEDVQGATAPYGHPLVFLAMGGFLIAIAMERHGLHERVALAIVARVGSGPRQLILGFMLAAAFLSMWISNTATTAMMLPIGLAVGRVLRPPGVEGPFNFGICLMLGIAYAATIGGVATLIGTPPNTILAGQARELLGIELGFFEWMRVGLPLSLVLLPLGWLLLTRCLYPPGELGGDADAVIQEQRSKLGPISRGEWIVGVVFVTTALAWVLRSPKALGGWQLPGITSFAPGVDDSTIAMGAALLLFVTPISWQRLEFALDWGAARKLPWGVLLLFGGGFALAGAMKSSGLAAWIGSGVVELGALPGGLVILCVAILFVFLTEITSNIATTSMAMPVMAGAALGLEIEPLVLMATASLSACMAFMLPVATPPNAIVFGSGYLTMSQMVRAGIWLNLVAIALVTLVALFLVPCLLP